MKLADTSLRYKSPDSRMPIELAARPAEAHRTDMKTDCISPAPAARDKARLKLNWDHYASSRLVDFHRR